MNRKVVLGAVSLVVVAAVLAGAYVVKTRYAGGPSAAAPDANTGLTIVDSKVGEGREAAVGNNVTVNYTGWLYDTAAPGSRGRQFDSSIGREPFTFHLGVGQVIRGWDRGVVGMKVGGKRTLTIASRLAYGPRGAGEDIPPNATLVFDVELLAVQD